MQQVLKQLKLGTRATTAKSGTDNTLSNMTSETKRTESGLATTVGYLTQHKALYSTSAATTVNQKPGEHQELIERSEYVDAAKNIAAINTQNKKGVEKAVVERVSREYVGPRNTYDLMVENHHEYVANNLLVSNCWDATRYVYTEFFGLRLRKPTQRVHKKHVRKVYGSNN